MIYLLIQYLGRNILYISIEAMAAGLYVITTDYGALFETCAEFSSYIPYQKNYLALAQNFAFAIEAVAKLEIRRYCKKHLERQIDYTNQFL
jgi:glycosyltransferase involved in cell wall biosynthesis